MNGEYGGQARIRRRLGFDHNPLRRRSDRLQAVVRVFVASLFLAGCVTAVFAGRGVYEEQRTFDRLDEAYGYQVDATVVSVSSTMAARDGSATQYRYRLAWHDTAGRRHVDSFSTTATGRRTGTVPLWIDHRGEASVRPPMAGQAAAVGFFGGIMFALYVTVALAVVYGAFTLALDRARTAAWDEEWDAVEPQWRRQVL